MNNFVYLILTKVPDCKFEDICTDSTEIFFSKLRSAELNYHLQKLSFFFTDPYCAEGGGSNKHCLLSFIHLISFWI